MQEYPVLFVCLLGIGTVFVGLISIVLLCTLMGALCKAAEKKPVESPVVEKTADAPAGREIVGRSKLVAAVSAVIAEELGEDVSAIRVRSFKKI